MPERYDVIIAGGGPAGATAAFFLGRAGKKVLVLEKELAPCRRKYWNNFLFPSNQ
jgi:flavin-dependent dehydrogenase